MKEYYEIDALNFSTLAALDSNYPGQVFEVEAQEREITSAMSRGNLVDCLLTSPHEFDELFIIAHLPELTQSVKNVIDFILIENKDYTDENILNAAKLLNYGGSNWTDKTILSKLKFDDSRVYFERKKLTKDKILISQDEYDKAVLVVEILKTHEFTKWIFNSEDNIELLFQVPIYWERLGVKCKALLDIVLINHDEKKIYPIDLKTKSDSKFAFKSSFMRYKYYLQAAWYTEAVQRSLLEKYKNYEINNFIFLVTSFDYPEPPLLYRCSDEMMKVGKYGGYYNGEKLKGIYQLFDDYLWYLQQDKVDFTKDLYESKGFIEMDFLKRTNDE